MALAADTSACVLGKGSPSQIRAVPPSDVVTIRFPSGLNAALPGGRQLLKLRRRADGLQLTAAVPAATAQSCFNASHDKMCTRGYKSLLRGSRALDPSHSFCSWV